MRRYYLIRHGRFVDQLSSGHFPESELSEIGVQQAQLTASHLARLIETPFAIHTSTMLRAVQTGELIAEHFSGAPIHSSPDLVECNQSQIPLPTGESTDEQAEAAPLAEAGFDRLFVSPEYSGSQVVICHGNIICYFLARIAKDEFWRRRPVPNCSITTIDRHANGRIDVVSFAEAEHLDQLDS